MMSYYHIWTSNKQIVYATILQAQFIFHYWKYLINFANTFKYYNISIHSLQVIVCISSSYHAVFAGLCYQFGLRLRVCNWIMKSLLVSMLRHIFMNDTTHPTNEMIPSKTLWKSLIFQENRNSSHQTMLYEQKSKLFCRYSPNFFI